MKLSPPQTVAQIAELLGAEVRGDAALLVTGINEMNRVALGDVVFVDHEKWYEKALASAATTIIINKDVNCPAGKALVVCEDPFGAHNKLVQHFGARQGWNDAKPTIGEGTEIHPSAVIAANAVIGKNCLIQPGVVIHENTTIGNNVIIQSNAVIGGDAFYYKKRPTGYDRMRSCGGVEIEDDVEIGALCTIDRGVSDLTRIGRGTKLDAQVHVGHDTHIGKDCLIAAQVGISGACNIEDGVTLWGQVGIPSKIRIGEKAVVMGQSGIMSSVEGGKSYLGSPAEEARKKMREIAMLRKLPDIIDRLEKKE